MRSGSRTSRCRRTLRSERPQSPVLQRPERRAAPAGYRVDDTRGQEHSRNLVHARYAHVVAVEVPVSYTHLTYWIRTYGLRKAQYMAVHKSIISTEEYLPNHIEELAEDITKFNTF